MTTIHTLDTTDSDLIQEVTSAFRRELPAQLAHLTDADIEAIGAELDAIRQEVLADLGQADADYIRRIVRIQRACEVGGRGLLYLSFLPPAWLAGTLALGVSKILDNMEIGHNVMHGQYDWMGDPALQSTTFEWDSAQPADQWKHSHNFLHHTWTNVVGKDRDLGYGVLRLTEDEEWSPRHLANPVIAFLLAVFFQWGVALHDVEVDEVRRGNKPWAEAKELLGGVRNKGGKQFRKDYLWFPLLGGPLFPLIAAGNAGANLMRNLWAFTIIFCGHFPDDVATFTEESVEGETRGQWYIRQMAGSANLSGGKVFHVMSGNLSHQIEHHLFPDLPARRYQDLAPRVQDLCARYDLPYTTGPLWKQFGQVVRKICRLALPTR